MTYSARWPQDTRATVADAFSPCPEKANATEIRYTKLKEKHSELINTHAELLRKVTLLPVPGRVRPLLSSLHHRQCGSCLPSPTPCRSHRPAPRDL